VTYAFFKANANTKNMKEIVRKSRYSVLKGTVPQDFQLQGFFMNQRYIQAEKGQAVFYIGQTNNK
jgi:hypothetical protein